MQQRKAPAFSITNTGMPLSHIAMNILKFTILKW